MKFNTTLALFGVLLNCCFGKPDNHAENALAEPIPTGKKAEVVAQLGKDKLRGRNLQDFNVEYEGTICDHETDSVQGFPCTTETTWNNPSTWHYWNLFLEGGTEYNFEVDRVDCNLDPAMALHRGIVTTAPSSLSFCQSLPGVDFIKCADDNDSHECEGDWPFDDPHFVHTPSYSADYTLVVIEYLSDFCDGSYEYKIVIDPAPICNHPPVAVCDDVTVSATSDCSASASIDGGSYDPDADAITLTQDPAGPYPVGTTSVTLTVDDGQASDSCTAAVTVTDDEAPVVDCGDVGVIAPCQVPVSLSFGSMPKSNGCPVYTDAFLDGCYFCNGAGRIRPRDCVVSASGSTATITEAGGVKSHIIFDLMATNAGASNTGSPLSASDKCTICTQNPSVDFEPGCSDTTSENSSNGYVCATGFPYLEFECGR